MTALRSCEAPPIDGLGQEMTGLNPVDSRTPVLVGVGAVTQRPERFARLGESSEPIDLMVAALAMAAEDAGSRVLLERADRVRVPRGMWSYRDPGRLIADALGANAARTSVAEVGILQTSLFGLAAADIANGAADVVLVAGGEAKARAQAASRAGVELPLREQPEGTVADEVLAPMADIVSPVEIECGLGAPFSQYALIDNALRVAENQSVEDQRDEIADLWAGMSRVAAENPDAWQRDSLSREEIRDATPANRMLAFPYTKRHCSNWNVDQAAGLIFCAAGLAERLGIARERWIFPLSVAESNHMVPLTERARPHRCPGFKIAGDRASRAAGRSISEAQHIELYSCFPSAVRVQLRELGLVERPPPYSVTGGMASAGGPLNNFVLQSLVCLAQRLRRDAGSLGVLTAISGLVTKQGVSLWSSEPGPGFEHADVGDEVEAETATVDAASNLEGSGRVVSCTVLFQGDAPYHAVLLCDLEDGRRSVVARSERAFAERILADDPGGRRVEISDAGASLRAL